MNCIARRNNFGNALGFERFASAAASSSRDINWKSCRNLSAELIAFESETQTPNMIVQLIKDRIAKTTSTTCVTGVAASTSSIGLDGIAPRTGDCRSDG